MTGHDVVREFFPGDCRSILPTLPAGSVQCCVTSPPYWGLRDYGIEGQIGLERTPEDYVARMLEVFREVRRVLRDDGTLWLNLAASYFGGVPGSGGKTAKQITNGGAFFAGDMRPSPSRRGHTTRWKQKDMVPIPWMVAMALQADGWWLRSDIIWHKPNPMPESVRDRPTKAHEYLFLFAKGHNYYYDADAVRVKTGRESAWDEKRAVAARTSGNLTEGKQAWKRPNYTHPSGRSLRTVWTIASEPYAGAHFATFPPKLIEPCILAGSRPGDIVLDPFLGSGTTAEVAQRLGRGWIGIDLQPRYTPMHEHRTAQQAMVL